MSSGIEAFRQSDEESRERIREALDINLFVEAGAGTGKTRALVSRLVSLVASGRPIERIVAITFTEKAAAELKERVRQGLEEARVSGGANQAVESALKSLDRAQISTIHSFAQTLLKTFAAEAGVDPDFAIQDEVMADRRLQERWRTYLDELGADPQASAAVDRVLSLGMSTGHLEKLARDLYERPHFVARLAAESWHEDDPEWPDLRELQRDLDSLPLHIASEQDPLRIRVERLRKTVASIAEAKDNREAVLASGASVYALKFGVSRQDQWGGKETIERVRECAREACDVLTSVLAGCRRQALAAIMPLILRFVVRDESDRRRSGELTFDDLILHVRDLLRDSPEAVRSFRARYDTLLIDEFQDTDPLQMNIALSFATDPDSGQVEQGRLFLVGDPKQSIYRFRRADMAIYTSSLETIEASGGEQVELAVNWRSRPQVLDWVNAVCGPMIGEGVRGVQPVYKPIHPARSDDLAGPGIAWFGGLSGEKVRESRWIEARDIAARCASVIAEGWQVAERGGPPRLAEYRDIAVLIPRRMILLPLERALSEAGIPYRVEGGSLIYRTQEVRDLLNSLAAIDDPADEVAVVAALRSAAFACADVDLARHRADGGGFNYLSRDLEERQGPVADGLRVLADYHHERHRVSLAALVERFAVDRGLVEIGVLDQGDRNSFRRVRYVVEQARRFEAARPESLRAFVSWMEQRSGEQILDHEGAGVDDDEDAVRILTVHGAKGLEFPIVFLAGLSSSPNPRRDTYMLDHNQDRFAVCVGPESSNSRFEIGDVEGLREMEKEHEDSEFRRLLYVATTRARDHLVVSLHHAKNSHNCAATQLIDAGAMQYADELPSAGPVDTGVVRPFDRVRVDLPALSDDEFLAAREQLVAAAKTLGYTSATALRDSTGAPGKEDREDATEPWARGRGGTHRGRAVHAAIQSLPLDADAAAIDAFAHAQAVAEAIPEQKERVADLVRAALGSQAAARGRAASRTMREVPFAVTIDGRVLEGFIDLLIQNAEGIEIVDWKTDQIPPDDVPARLRDYRLQAGLYVYGIQAATGLRVSAVTYVFASAGVEMSPGEPDALAAAALERLRDDGGTAVA